MSWKEDNDCCSWDGVTCDKVTGHVIGLDLSCSWLLGNIPSNSSLFLLPHLQRLNLAFNDFSLSQISSSFNRFPNLTHLNLSFSNFIDQIPSEISHLSKLVSLDLSANYVSLETPALEGLVQNLTELKELILNEVDMYTIAPRSLTNLSSSLTSLNLAFCELQGSFPDNIFRLPNLQKLNLEFNTKLTGVFTEGNWSSPLSFVNVSFTNFQGELSDSIGNLKSLKNLDLYHCNFTGSIPVSLGNLTQLTYLDLSYNNFIGHIPSSLSKLEQLRHLNFRDNNFTGEIPDIFVNLTQLSLLDLSRNQLAGPIPSHISWLPNLATLALGVNSLNGTIASRLFTLPFLETIDLRNNQLTGCIDKFQNNSLRVIQLNNNRLQGSIPNSIFELESLTDLALSSNNLSGIVELYMFTKLKNLQILDLSHNNLSLSTTFIVNSSFPELNRLGLSSCNISEFPYMLRNQDQLQVLDLSQNKIHGQIPNWLWEMGMDTLAFLNLSHNSLIGVEQLPWKNLQYLDLHSNLLQGSLPIPPPETIVFLISNNNLSGEIPHSICNISKIEVLDLSYNKLSGKIPECMGNFSGSLRVLDLQKNKFYGTIPGTFLKNNSLRTLNLNGNALEGPVPPSLINCTMLEVLDLGNNNINDTFPIWLENLSKLQVLVLRSNNFYGSIWSSYDHSNSFPMLRIFYLSNNSFNGFLPTRYFENLKAMMNTDEAKRKLHYIGETYYQDSVTMVVKGLDIVLLKIVTTFTTIDFSNNYFNGEIPKVIRKLHSLRLLNLSQNSLTGHIPISLENLTLLESLDLSSNKLVGEIPSQLASLTFLAVLNLSHNQLVGPIPQGNQFDTFQNDSYGGNSGLCGFPLSNKCAIHETPQPVSSILFPDDQDMSSWFDWKIIMMGYGCGLLLGLFIGYIIFSTGKPHWFLRVIDKSVEKYEKSEWNWKRLSESDALKKILKS